MQLLSKHKVFVSAHHGNDQAYQDCFAQLLGNQGDVAVSRSVQIGDVGPIAEVDPLYKTIRDNYLGDTNITIVLIGADTWKRRHVDWEIGASIRQTPFSTPSGLMDILLPTYNFPAPNQYDTYTIPPRLHANFQCGFAKIHMWTDSADEIHGWLEEAFRQRLGAEPDNSYPLFLEDRTEASWQV
jgi:hypothetical protein